MTTHRAASDYRRIVGVSRFRSGLPSRFPGPPNGKPDLSGVWQGGGVSLYGDAADGHAKAHAPRR